MKKKYVVVVFLRFAQKHHNNIFSLSIRKAYQFFELLMLEKNPEKNLNYGT